MHSTTEVPSVDRAPTVAVQHARTTSVAKTVKPRRRRGGLHMIMDMPLDVVLEIMSRLTPGDLLSLSRTTRTYRELLMRRNSEYLWKAARQNVKDYPPCPEDLSEPELANLLYTNYCSNCLKPNVKWIYWEAYARYCKDCFTGLKKTALWVMNLERHLKRISPHAQAEQLAINFGNILQSCLPTLCTAGKEWDVYFRDSDLSELLDALTSRFKQFEEVLAERQKVLIQKRECIVAMQKWHANKLRAREAEINLMKSQRYDSIITKLSEAGWKDVIEQVIQSEATHKAFRNLPCVKEPRPLTETSWGKIQETLVQWLEETRLRLIREERDRIRTERIHTFDKALGAMCPCLPGEPSRVDVAFGIPRVREVIELPFKDTVTEESFAFLQDILPAFRTEWRRKAEAYLSKLVRAQVGELAEDFNVLKLAIESVFRCKLCKHSEGYPNVLSHSCERHILPTDGDLASADMYRLAVIRAFTRSGYGGGLVHWDTTAFRWSAQVDVLKSIVTCVGLDPRRATVADMDASPHRFTCRSAADAEGALTAMNWRHTFHHVRHYKWSQARKHLTAEEYSACKPRRGTVDHDAVGCHLVILPAHLAEAARAIERDYKPFIPPASVCMWTCTHCPVLAPTDGLYGTQYDHQSAVQHVQESHGVENPEPERDFCRAYRPDGIADDRDPVFLVAERTRKLKRQPVEWAFKKGIASYVAFDEWDGERVLEFGSNPTTK